MPHSTDAYQTGGGILSIAAWSGTSPPADLDLEDMGNSPEFTIEPTVEKLVHQSSRGSTLDDDKSVTTKKGYTLSFKLDEPAVDQLTMFFQGIKDSANSIRPLEQDTLEYRVKFTPDYESGEEWIYDCHRVEISAAGALNLIKMNEWNELEFTGKGLSDVANHPTNRFWSMTKQTV